MASSLLQAVEISASQFLDIFHHYDNDGNGFIEGKELQSFIRELREARQKAGLDLTDEMRQFVSEYEETTDRRIGLVELVQILPTEENFLLFFRQQLSSASQFLQTWRRYDVDHSGYIEAEELKNFLKDLLLKNQRTCDQNKLDEYTAATGIKTSRRQFNRTFDLYDQDGSGFMDEAELDVLLRDLCENNKKVLDSADLPLYRASIMQLSDRGKLYRSELALLLCDED
eukprot:superscaffoldBa00006071_g21105